MEKICEGADTSAISRRLRMIERHHRTIDLGGASGFLPNTLFILLVLPSWIILPFALAFAFALTITASTFKKYL